MPLVTTRDMLREAQAKGYAVGAFNVENMEMAQAVVQAAQEMRAPVIIQTTPGTLKYAPPQVFSGLVTACAQAADVPVALHLDHGDSQALALACAGAGYTSLMIDGSLLPFAQNIELTRRVIAMAGELPVEAELGTVGGKEDDHEAQAQYTDVAQAVEFVRETAVFAFAVAIGTAHGVYKGEPQLDLERLEAIRDAVDVPLVLHGTSGVPDEQVRRCIARGICKVNYATDLRIAFSAGVKEALTLAPDTYDPKKYLGRGRDSVRQRVCELIRICGCDGKG